MLSDFCRQDIAFVTDQNGLQKLRVAFKYQARVTNILVHYLQVFFSFLFFFGIYFERETWQWKNRIFYWSQARNNKHFVPNYQQINNVRKSEHTECVVHCVWCLNPLYSKGCWVHFLRNGNRQAPVSWINSWGSAAFNFQGMHSFTVITSSLGFISSFSASQTWHVSVFAFRIGGGWGLIFSEEP